MRESGFGLIAFAGLLLSAATASAALCPAPQGPPVPGAMGPPLNGFPCQLTPTAGATDITAVFVGFNAANTDVLLLPGVTAITGVNPAGLLPLVPPPPTAGEFTNVPAGSTLIFNNKASASGDAYKLSGPGVTPGIGLDFFLGNDTTKTAGAGGANMAYEAGVAYTNSDAGGFSPVYHMFYANPATIAEYNALFPAVSPGCATGLGCGGDGLAYIMSHGGLSAFTFMGIEDLDAAATDDWNDLVFAFSNVVPETVVPEPASMALLGTGLLGMGLLRRRRKG